MVRKKRQPQSRLSEGTTAGGSGRSLDQEITGEEIGDIIDDFDGQSNEEEELDSDDEEFNPKGFFARPKRRKAKAAPPKKKKKKVIDYGPFQDILDESVAKIEIHKQKPDHLEYLFAKLELELKLVPDTVTMKKCSSFWIYICPDGQDSSLYFEWRELESSDPEDMEFKHFIVRSNLEAELWKPLEVGKHFHVHMKSYYKNTMELEVFLEKSAISEVSHPSDSANSFRNSEKLMKHFYGVGLPKLESPKLMNHDIDTFFKDLKSFDGEKPSVEIDPQHKSLLPILRPYQKAAVRWMLYQELPKPSKDQLHPLYQEVTLLNDKVLYYNVAGFYLVKNKPKESCLFPGGILADEMGLGKTVEVLACMLNNPRKDLPVLATISQPQPIELLSGSSESDDSCMVLSDSSDDNPPKSHKNKRKAKEMSKKRGKEFSEDSDSSVEVIVKRKRKNISIVEDVDSSNEEEEESVRKPTRNRNGKKSSFDPTDGMTLKEKLNFHYQNALAPYSAKSMATITPKWNATYFDTKVERKTFFECICGQKANSDRKLVKVQCSKCGLSQHAKCVQFDLSNPARGEYLCPHCWVNAETVPSRATLIIAPSTITGQWVEEIKKHLKEKSIKMIIYNGVAKDSYIQPVTLADSDIVITAYETLQKELDYVDLPHSNSEAGRRLRFPKRFMATPSPLPCIDWWRICLDEAQMVESPNKAAAMALRLSCVNRWCVTGTPIEYSVDDLQGLLLFLGVDPYGQPHWWKKCIYEPFCHGQQEKLLHLVNQYMWRNSKKDVEHQLSIPGQTEEVHWLDFTPVEAHFYKRLHQSLYQDQQHRLRKVEDHSQRLSDLDARTFYSLLQPLLSLRHACNHPQVVRGQFSSSRRNMTMEELLENLVQKTKVEAEDCHRSIIACRNGMAALHIINKEYNEAVDIYREVLKTIDEASQSFRTDSLQKLHTLHNLKEILQHESTSSAPTLRDSELSKEADSIREKYLRQHPIRIAEYKEECLENTAGITDLEKKTKSKIVWYLAALESFNDDFVTELRSEILSRHSRFEQKKSVFHPIRNCNQLLSLLNKYSNDTVKLRKKMLEGIESLLDIDPSKFVDEAVDCHLRPTLDKNLTCKICKVHGLFTTYEDTLFSMKEAQQNRETERAKETEDIKDKAQVKTAKRKGTWGCNDVEVALKYLQTKCLSRVDQEIMQDSNINFQILQAMKKEFKNYRILWRGIFDHVSALDEVNMATIRLRLKYPGEKLPMPKKKQKKKNEDDLVVEENERPAYILERNEVYSTRERLEAEEIVCQRDLATAKRQLLYLQNLQKESESGAERPPCPVCQGELGKKWAVFQCNHSFCLECTDRLCKPIVQLHGSIKCPLCRQQCRIKEINFVQMKKEGEENAIKIQGSLSTKMEGVVRTLLEIKEKDPHAKVLIFSTWVEVLSVLTDSLAQNGIIHRTLLNSVNFQINLSAFKNSDEITALLLPVHSGANGLNLTEASHIILVEPILNRGEELQALGRIHRIGQTKNTYVHRLIVRNTIEEKMFNVLSSKPSDSEDYSLTVGDIYKLFEAADDVP